MQAARVGGTLFGPDPEEAAKRGADTVGADN